MPLLTRPSQRRTSAVVTIFMATAVPADVDAQEPGLSGELAFRAEFMRNENFAANDATRPDDRRFRFRARGRLGGTYRPSDIVEIGFRLSTGQSDFPSSGWSTLDDDFRRDPIAFDRLFITVAPHRSVDLRLGYHANPLYHATELVWDRDVSPGGVAEVLQFGPVRIVAGQFMLRELRDLRSSSDGSSFLWAHGVSFAHSGAVAWQLGGFHYLFGNPNSLAASIDAGNLNGEFRTNRFAPGNARAYFSGFQILGGAFDLRGGRLAVAAEVAVNIDARSDAARGPAYAGTEALAAALQLTYGHLAGPWSWSVTGGVYHIEADAVLAVYNSDDVQQTNVNTIPVWIHARMPGGVDLVWDSYFQWKVDSRLASNGGVVHDENATKIRTRLSIHTRF